jgi:hypothetical protein
MGLLLCCVKISHFAYLAALYALAPGVVVPLGVVAVVGCAGAVVVYLHHYFGFDVERGIRIALRALKSL